MDRFADWLGILSRFDLLLLLSEPVYDIANSTNTLLFMGM
jgi:hypothetical protein